MEKVADITATSGFTNQTYYINPGNSLLFPIFSASAVNYETYIPRGQVMGFHFLTQSFVSTGQESSAGSVTMVVNYDPTDPPFTDQNQMEDYVGMVKGPPFTSFSLNIPIKKLRSSESVKAYFVNPSNNTAAYSTDSPKFYDYGTFQIATNNNTNTGVIGSLYVEYEFEMIKPKLNNLTATAFNISHIATNGTSAAATPLLNAFSNYNGLNATWTNTAIAVKEGASVEVALVILCTSGTMSTSLAVASTVVNPAGTLHNDNLLANSTNSTANSVTSNTNSLSTYFYYTDSNHISTVYTLTTTGTLASGTVDIFIIALPNTLAAMDPNVRKRFLWACMQKIAPMDRYSQSSSSIDIHEVKPCCAKNSAEARYCSHCGDAL